MFHFFDYGEFNNITALLVPYYKSLVVKKPIAILFYKDLPKDLNPNEIAISG